ncbi:hypothetical protein V6V47_01025 [Micromonospora sp. CPCC 205539]|uniref:hypothetical protein n=1 Tax=Micromonospora sp. CPCC 205539 TaxID=3122408 RepID=UPI002FF1E35A
MTTYDELAALRQMQRAAALATTVGDLDPGVPLVLLPVRLETRYDADPASTRLRIRVYPDDVHLDAHEPELTDAEAEAGRAYWRGCWTADEPDRRRAWTLLVTTVGPERAAWTARVLTPVNPRTDPEPLFPGHPTRAGRWTRAVRAELLPDCWRAEAWRDGVRIATATGGLIRRPLPAGPDPAATGTELVDDGMRWMTDFGEAVDAGMALVLDLPDRDPVDLLTVVGVRATEPAGDGLADVLTAHRYGVGDGLDLVAHGAPTNNDEQARSVYDAAPYVDPFAPGAGPVPGDGGDADRLASAFGLPIAALSDLPGADQRRAAREVDLATLLWPGTWGYYLTQLLRLDEFDQEGPAWRRWIIDSVRAGGPLPVLRVGRQPYGVLPVTSMERWRPAQTAGLVSVELVPVTKGTTTRLRVFGGLTDRASWTFLEPRVFALPSPRSARLVAAATDPSTSGERTGIVIAYASDADPATGGLTCLRTGLDDAGPTAPTALRVGPVPGGFPGRRLQGLAVAVGRSDLVFVLQFESLRPRLGPQTAVLVGSGFAGSTVETWSALVDVTARITATERVTSAALLPHKDGHDLVVVTEEAAAPDTPLARWHVGRGLGADGQVADWSGPFPVGPASAAGIGSVGTTLTVADVDGDGAPEALLAAYRTLPDGTVVAGYTVGFSPVDGVFTWPAGWYANLGQPPAGLRSAALVAVPWTPFREPATGLGTPGRQVNLLRRLTEQWREAAAGVAHVHDGDRDPDRTLLDLLATDAVSQTVEARPFVGAAVLEGTARVLGRGQPTGSAAAVVAALLDDLGITPGRPVRLGRGGYTDLASPIDPARPGEDLTGTAAGPEREQPLTWLREMRDATPAELHDKWIGADEPLLARLVRHSLLQAYADAAFALVPVPSADPPPLPEPELVDLVDLTAPDPTVTRTLTSWRHLSTATYQGTPVAEVLHKLARGQNPPPQVQPLAEALAALGRLAERPAGELARLTGGALDLATHRLDAWITAVATQRLTQLRAAKPTGAHTGGYGFVRDLRPATGAPSTGYVHAPSMTHAATAAVLRSGHLTHPGGELAVDLSSGRVRAALDVLGALRQGQSLGAALGYRFERALSDAGAARYLTAVRQLVPLDVGLLTPAPEGVDVSTVAAMVTTDGLALLALREGTGLPWGATPAGQQQALPAAGSADQRAIDAAIERVADVADAIADIGVAEGVHQLLQRNPIRAAGTLDALTRGEVPASDDPDVLRTPRQGIGVTHRLLLVAPDPDGKPAASALAKWPATPAQRARHARAVAEPRLNAWAALAFGDPARVFFRVASAGGKPEQFSLTDVGLAPWDILAASSPGVASLAQTNLGRRLLRHAQATLGTTDLTLVTERAESWDTDRLSLPELLTLAESARSLVMGARAAHAGDLRAGAAQEPGQDALELASRASAARKSLTGALDDLRPYFTLDADQRATVAALFPGLDTGDLVNLLDLPAYRDVAAAATAVRLPAMPADDLVDVLDRLSGFGISDAAAPPASADVEADRADLAIRSRAAYLQATARLDASAKATATGDGPAAVESLFGEGFRVLPLFTPGLSTTAAPSGVTTDEVAGWLDGVATVRAGAARLQDLLLGSEVTGGDLGGWDVVQLPAGAATRWVALAPDPGGPRIPAGCVSVVVSGTDATWRTSAAAALLVDAWVEVVPSPQENTAIAFHLDTPDATAPQSILLAVAPDPGRRWTWDAISDVVAETAALAQIRAVDPDLVPAYGHLLPAIVLAHNIGGDPGGDTVSTRFEG